MYKLILTLVAISTFNTLASDATNDANDKNQDTLPQVKRSKVTSGYRFHAVNFIPKSPDSEIKEKEYTIQTNFWKGFITNETQKKSYELGTLASKKYTTPNTYNFEPYKTRKKTKRPSITNVNTEITTIQQSPKEKRSIESEAPQNISKKTKVSSPSTKEPGKIKISDLLN